jgi:hypothetical protein
LPEGSTVTERGLHPVATVAGVVGVKTPVLALIVNIETVLSSLFAVYTNLPRGSMPIPWGRNPVATVAGVVGERTPVVESMVNIEIVPASTALDPRFAT